MRELPLFGSTETLFFSRASATKLAACCRSCANSPLNTMSSPPGPKICAELNHIELFGRVDQRIGSLLRGVEIFWRLRCRSGGSRSFRSLRVAAAEDGSSRHRHTNATAPSNAKEIGKDVHSPHVDFIRAPGVPLCSPQRYLRRPPPPPPRLKPPPPPRDPMLEAPRLLLLRALDPLYPREPPPKASRFPPPLRERSRLPMRSAPPACLGHARSAPSCRRCRHLHRQPGCPRRHLRRDCWQDCRPAGQPAAGRWPGGCDSESPRAVPPNLSAVARSRYGAPPRCSGLCCHRLLRATASHRLSRGRLPAPRAG